MSGVSEVQIFAALGGGKLGPDGRRIHRRIVLGTTDELRSIASARNMAVGQRGEININNVQISRKRSS